MSIRDKMEGLEEFIGDAEDALTDEAYTAFCGPAAVSFTRGEIERARRELGWLETQWQEGAAA